MATKNKILNSILPALERAVENLPNKVDIIGFTYAYLGHSHIPQLEIQLYLGIDNVAPDLKRHRLQKEPVGTDGCGYPYRYYYVDHGVTVFQLSNEDGELEPWPEGEDEDEDEEEEEDEYDD